MGINFGSATILCSIKLPAFSSRRFWFRLENCPQNNIQNFGSWQIFFTTKITISLPCFNFLSTKRDQKCGSCPNEYMFQHCEEQRKHKARHHGSWWPRQNYLVLPPLTSTVWPLDWLSSFLSTHPQIKPPHNSTFWGSGNYTHRLN